MHPPHALPTPSAAVSEPVRTLDPPEVAVKRSVHGGVGCCECHARRGADVAGSCTGEVRCTQCHVEAARAFATSVHGRALAGGRPAARCPDCHGDHEIQRASHPASLANRRRLPLTCGHCHANQLEAEKLGLSSAPAVAEYLADSHGRALVAGGLVAAPGCTDCHGPGHELRKASARGAPTSRARVSSTCGRCHPAIFAGYRAGIHGQRFAQGNPGAPNCIDCHVPHRTTEPSPSFILASTELCSKCHADRARQYRATYHGKAHALGVSAVATCFDCHEAHEVRPSTDPKSSLYPTQRPATCRRCHQGSSARFASIFAHADPGDRQSYPTLYWAERAMLGLLGGLLTLFGVHSLLWLGRGLRERSRNPQLFREERRRWVLRSGEPSFLRFRAIDRFCHALLTLGFLVLVATGMPLKFHEADWAKRVFTAVGGARVAGGLHRIGAALVLFALLAHLVSLVRLLRRRRELVRDDRGRLRWRKLAKLALGPDSPLPGMQDLRDAWAHLRWFVRGGPRPGFDRFAYWEKLDYAVVFACVGVMALTGIVLWFPEAVTRVFPGWLVNFSQLLHGDEALILAGLVLVVHLFHVAFRPDRFPLDPVMFSGRVNEEQLRSERPRLHGRLLASGRLESTELRDDWLNWKPIVSGLGLLALVVGLALGAAIFWGLGSILFG